MFLPPKSRTGENSLPQIFLSNDDRRSFESKGITRGGETEFSRRGKVALAQFSVVKGVRDPDSLDTRNLFSRIARLSSFFLFNPSMRWKARIICRTKSRATVLSTRGHRGFLIMSRPWFTRLWKEPLVTSVNEGNPPGVLSLGDRTSGGQGIAISTLAEEIRALGHGVRYACGLGNYPFLPPPLLVLVETTFVPLLVRHSCALGSNFARALRYCALLRVERNEVLGRVLREMKERDDILRDAIISSNWIERERGGGMEEDCCNEFGENFVEG